LREVLSEMKKLLICLAACCVAMSFPARAEWVFGPIDTLTSNGVYDETGPQCLGTNHMGYLNLTWRQEKLEGGWKILYTYKPPGQEWDETIEIETLTDHNRKPALAVDVAGYSHVVWDGLLDHYEIFYSNNKGMAGWETTVLSDTLSKGDYYDDVAPTIATDSGGNVHVAWIGHDTLSGEGRIFYATADPSGHWVVQMVEESQPISGLGWGDGRPWISATPEGVAHITYPDNVVLWGPGQVHHLWNTALGDTDWTDEVIETDNMNDVYSSIVAEPDGALHVLVSGCEAQPPATPYRSYYVCRPAGSAVWHSAQVLAGTGGTSPTLVMDMDGFAHVAGGWRWPGYTPCIFYWSNQAYDEWKQQRFVCDDDIYYCPSLVLDDGRFGHMAFCSEPDYPESPGEILYTKSTEPLITRSFIRGDVDGDETIAMDDAMFTLKYLYIPGSPSPACTDAADTDDNGDLSMHDAIYLLRYIYVPDSPEPTFPFPACGYDPTWDGLGCFESLCDMAMPLE
jgi:hypothetical protein